MMISGSHNVIEGCIFDGNRDTGLQISRRSSAVTDYKDWPSYNTILNCTSKKMQMDLQLSLLVEMVMFLMDVFHIIIVMMDGTYLLKLQLVQ